MKKKLSLILIIYFIFFNTSISEEIKVIDLHNQPIDEGLLKATQNDLNTNEDSFDSETNSDKEQNNNSVDQVLATDEVITSEIINEDSEES